MSRVCWREGVVTDHVTSHRAGNTSHRGGNTSHFGGNVSTSVEILLTAVRILLTTVGMFSPRWECSHPGGNVLTAVGMFSPRWECSHHGSFHQLNCKMHPNGLSSPDNSDKKLIRVFSCSNSCLTSFGW